MIHGLARACGAALVLAMVISDTGAAQQPSNLINSYPALSAANLIVTPVPLSVATVTTGGTAVTPIAAGQATAGGFLYNPSTATQPLCLSETATATTTNDVNTICILPGNSYTILPMLGAVSVNSSDSAHAFTGRSYRY